MLLKARTGFVLVCIFLDALGIGLIIPVLPRLIGVLSETREAQTAWYGMIMLSYGLMQFVSASLLGALSDRIGRRPVLLGGILGLGCMFSVPAFSSSLPLILASRIIGGILSANTAVAQAYIADITTGFQRAAGFGKIGAAYGIGFVVGPALGGILGHSDPRMPFLFASAICLVNFLYGALALPESLTEKQTQPLSLRAHNPLTAILRLVSVRSTRAFLFVLAASSLANGLLHCTWALYTEYRYSFTPLAIGLSVFALGISISLFQGVFLQRLILKIEPRVIVLSTLAASGCSLLVIGLSPIAAASVISCCTYAAASVVSPILTGAISRRTSVNEQGATIGSISALNSLMGSIAPALGTPLLYFPAVNPSGLGAGAPYYVASALIFAGLGILCFKGPAGSRQEPDPTVDPYGGFCDNGSE